ncbi:MAG: GNAT family N-acetyltransferase, partial [Promethearchaeota archaeon]
EADLNFLAEFTFNANKSKMTKMGLTIDKVEEILEKHFQKNVLSYILTCEEGDLGGWLVLYEKNQKELIINPGETLGGFPIIGAKVEYPEEVIKTLLSHTIKTVKASKYEAIELVLPITDETVSFGDPIIDAGFSLNVTYTDMTCDLTQIPTPQVTDKYQIKPVDSVSDEKLYEIYLQAFENGNAQFFKYQSEDEKKGYFKELYLKENADTDLSVAIFSDDKLVGFSYVLEFESGIKHISCMCVHPDYQGKGVGSSLMNYITKVSKEKGAHTINLGTEPKMMAYQLYTNHGFTDVASFNIYGWNK